MGKLSGVLTVIHFNTDVNFNKHKLLHNKPKAYNYTMTKGMGGSTYLLFGLCSKKTA